MIDKESFCILIREQGVEMCGTMRKKFVQNVAKNVNKFSMIYIIVFDVKTRVS
jgi:hypothetical protein